MKHPFKVRRFKNVFWLVLSSGALLTALAGCSSKAESESSNPAAANDTQKAALAAQQGAAADAANRQARQADEARRKKTP